MASGMRLLAVLCLAGEHLLPDGIDRLVLELIADFLPTEILSNSCARCIETVSGGNGEDDCIAIDTGAVGRGRLVDEPLRLRAGLAGFRGRLRAEDAVVELAVGPRCRRGLSGRLWTFAPAADAPEVSVFSFSMALMICDSTSEGGTRLLQAS